MPPVAIRCEQPWKCPPKLSVRLVCAAWSTALRSLRLLVAGLLVMALPSCYHMRSEAEPIIPRTFKIKAGASDSLARIRRLVEDEWQQRILEEAGSGGVLITTPYHFATDTGLGQPAGGRKYYTQLRIEVQQQDGQTLVRISPHNYEIRTTYAYGLGGEIRTMYKHYTYDEYPGMFDIVPLGQELDRVSTVIKNLFR